MRHSGPIGLLTVALLAGCGSSAASDHAHDSSDAGASSTIGAAGSHGPGDAAGGGGGFACTSDAAPGEMLDVPAGDFRMGCDDGTDSDCQDDEKPEHTVTLHAFQINRTEVTQDQYAACVTAGACNAPSCAWDCSKGEYPAACIAFDDAKAYCSWAGARLPSEAEWEKAARGSDGNKFPWGDSEPDCELTNMAGCAGGPEAVGSHAAGKSPYGALDMAGNVVEMVADWYDATYYARSPSSDPQGPATGTRFGGRGGGFKSESIWQRAAKRDWYDLTDAGVGLGFRCAQ
jgi:eukaryotic-like serine/threonine-protein kinase